MQTSSKKSGISKEKVLGFIASAKSQLLTSKEEKKQLNLSKSQSIEEIKLDIPSVFMQQLKEILAAIKFKHSINKLEFMQKQSLDRMDIVSDLVSSILPLTNG